MRVLSVWQTSKDLEPHLSFFQPTQLLNWKILSFERACISMTSSGDNIVECSSFCSSDECRKNGGIKSVRFSFIAKNIVSANPRILKDNLIRAFYYVQLWAEILERLSLLKFLSSFTPGALNCPNNFKLGLSYFKNLTWLFGPHNNIGTKNLSFLNWYFGLESIWSYWNVPKQAFSSMLK